MAVKARCWAGEERRIANGESGIAETPGKWQSMLMKQITIEQLHQETERWVKEAADNGGIVVTKDGVPLATLGQFASEKRKQWAQERLAALEKMPFIPVDSADLISEDRDR